MSMPLAPVEPVNLVSHGLPTNESCHHDCFDVPLINPRDNLASTRLPHTTHYVSFI